MKRMMSGRRVCLGPLIENWLMASHSLAVGCSKSTGGQSPHRFAIALVLDWHSIHQQAVKCPVGRQQRWGIEVDHLGQRIFTRHQRHGGLSRAIASRKRSRSSTCWNCSRHGLSESGQRRSHNSRDSPPRPTTPAPLVPTDLRSCTITHQQGETPVRRARRVSVASAVRTQNPPLAGKAISAGGTNWQPSQTARPTTSGGHHNKKVRVEL